MSLINDVMPHLEYLGYEVETDTKGQVSAWHNQWGALIIEEDYFGIFFIAVFDVNSKGKRHRLPLLEGVNEFNEKAIICKCFASQIDQVVFQAYYQTLDFDVIRFNHFIHMFSSEIARLVSEENDLIKFAKLG